MAGGYAARLPGASPLRCRRVCKARDGRGIGLQLKSMKSCPDCQALFEPTKAHDPRCPTCRNRKAKEYRQTAAYQIARQKYQASLKGQITTKAREQRPDIKEKRRLASRSPSGRRNKAKYTATPKARAARARWLLQWRNSPSAKASAAAAHQRRKTNPQWRLRKHEIDRRYRQTPKGRAVHAAMSERRRARKAQSPGCLTTQEWREILRLSKGRCFYCKQPAKLTMDHVIPLSKDGPHTMSNVVAACQPCNSRKNDRILLLL